MGIGRPSTYTDERASLICGRLAEGETLAAICKDEAMPSVATVYYWLLRQPSFQEAYTRAREAQMDTWADQIVEIADESSEDFTVTEDGREVVNSEHIQRSRLRVETRKWLMAKIASKRYGDRIQQDVDVKVGPRHETLLSLVEGADAKLLTKAP